MFARMRWTAQIGLLMAGLLVLAGCSHCGSGCCGGKKATRPPDPPSLGAAPSTGPSQPGLPPAAVSDARPYGGQKTCPVMGEPLGSMGEAIPVVVKGQTVYVCCPGCATKVRRDPEKYITIAAAERAQ